MLDSVELRSVITPIVTAPDSAFPEKEVVTADEVIELEPDAPAILFASRTLHVPAAIEDALAVTVVATVCVTVAPDPPTVVVMVDPLPATVVATVCVAVVVLPAGVIAYTTPPPIISPMTNNTPAIIEETPLRFVILCMRAEDNSESI